MPESIMTGTREPTAETIAGSTSTDAGAPSKCRPPWFDTQMPSAPIATRALGVLRMQDALEHESDASTCRAAA